MIDREQRDLDIKVLFAVRNKVETYTGVHFILTGSYSIEALTGSSVFHNDMDANVFVRDLEQTQSSMATSLSSLSFLSRKAVRPSYLEYDVTHAEGPARLLELNLLAVEQLTPDIFQLKKPSDRIVEIPTEVRTLTLLSGEEIPFRVKSLSYAIASWALRLSGLLTTQKRPVRKSDLDHFRKLLQQNYEYKNVLGIMSKHPQMEDHLEIEDVFNNALARLEKEF